MDKVQKHNSFNTIEWLPGPVTLGVERPGREADHSSLSNSVVKNARTPPKYVFMAWCMIKQWIYLRCLVLS
jgi:hypothetical protein